MSGATNGTSVALFVVARFSIPQSVAFALARCRVARTVATASTLFRLRANCLFTVQANKAWITVARERSICTYPVSRALQGAPSLRAGAAEITFAAHARPLDASSSIVTLATSRVWAHLSFASFACKAILAEATPFGFSRGGVRCHFTDTVTVALVRAALAPTV